MSAPGLRAGRETRGPRGWSVGVRVAALKKLDYDGCRTDGSVRRPESGLNQTALGRDGRGLDGDEMGTTSWLQLRRTGDIPRRQFVAGGAAVGKLGERHVTAAPRCHGCVRHCSLTVLMSTLLGTAATCRTSAPPNKHAPGTLPPLPPPSLSLPSSHLQGHARPLRRRHRHRRRRGPLTGNHVDESAGHCIVFQSLCPLGTRLPSPKPASIRPHRPLLPAAAQRGLGGGITTLGHPAQQPAGQEAAQGLQALQTD